MTTAPAPPAPPPTTNDAAQVPYHDMQAELAVLYCLEQEPDSILRISHHLKPQHFYVQAARQAYRVFLEETSAGDPPEYLTWQRRLQAEGIIRTGDNILIKAAQAFPLEAPAPHQITEHSLAIIQAFKRRSYADVGRKLNSMATDPQVDMDEIDEYAQSQPVNVFISADPGGSVIGMGELTERLLAKSEAHRDGKIELLYTGFPDLDKQLEGIEDDTLVIIAARPGMGKTSLLLGKSLNMARAGKHVMVFSLEMGADQLGYRLVGMMIEVNPRRIMRGQLDEQEWEKYMAALEQLADLNIYIDDTPGISPGYVRAKVRKQIMTTGVDAIMIDYLQLMNGEGRYASDVSETTHISKSLQSIAKREAPVFAASQLSRSCEMRQEKRPQLHDLRGSGSIEQDAHVVIFIYRDEYYNPDTQSPGIAELLVEKNRNGPTGVVRMAWVGTLTSFRSLAHQPIML